MLDEAAGVAAGTVAAAAGAAATAAGAGTFHDSTHHVTIRI